MKDRIIKEIKTTVLGMLVIVASLAFAWTERVEFEASIGYLLWGISLILGRDPKIPTMKR